MALLKAKKSNKGQFDQWDELLSEGQSQAVYDDLPDERKVKWTRRLVKTATYLFLPLLLLCLLLLMNVAGALKNQNGPDLSQLSASSPGRTVATQTITSWLKRTPSPLPGGQIVSWDGSKEIAPVVSTTDNQNANATGPTFKREIDYFTLVDANGQAYKVSVPVSVDPRNNAAKAAGGPSIEGAIPVSTDEWDSNGPWAGLQSSNQFDDSVSTAVEGWAAAYVSGDPTKLQAAVGDADVSHVYVPLSGIQSVKTSINYVAQPNVDDPSVMIAQVSMDMLWNGEKAPKQGDNSNDGLPETMMDVLVERANTAAPIITAWGAPGSGPTLARYQNAVTNTGAIVAPSASASAVAPSTTTPASSTPSASPSKK